MHDGSFPTLHHVVHYYDRGGSPNANLDPRIRPLDLDAQEIDDLVAFLESLTSEERPGLGPVPKGRRETLVRIETLFGKPCADLEVRVVPFGDRLQGAPGKGFTVRTDRHGRLRFRFPDWTHVRLEASGLALGEGAPLPDYVREATLIAASRRETAVRVRVPGRLPESLTTTDGVDFLRIRGLGRGEALYVASRSEARGEDVIEFRDLPRGAVGRRYAVTFGAGFSQAIDLRPEPGAPSASGSARAAARQADRRR
jgi:hypothetical protein